MSGQRGSSQQVRVDMADAAPHQAVAFDKEQHLLRAGEIVSDMEGLAVILEAWLRRCLVTTLRREIA